MFDWIVRVLTQTGYFGVALLMFLENVFPPIPSELIMPLAGFTAARGELSLALVIVAGTLGSLSGAFFWYWVGRKLGRARVERFAARHGRWLTLCPPDIERAFDWFERHGGRAVLIGRVVPAVRSMISVPAGIAHMELQRFATYSALGTALWTALLTAAGYLLEGQYDRVGAYLNPVSNVVFGALVLWYLWRVVTFGRRSHADARA
jgi:membrane protein DedA with SNARE-associated domain